MTIYSYIESETMVYSSVIEYAMPMAMVQMYA